MSDYYWKKIDMLENPPVYLEPEDQCYYAREYTAREGYQHSSTNQLIFNYKKPMSQKGKSGWHYKELAIQQFAKELASWLDDARVVAPIPCSKQKGDPEYDPRVEDTLSRFARLNTQIRIECPIIRRESGESLHLGGKRTVQSIYEKLAWVGFASVPEQIILVDDVLTAGTSFKACQRIIEEHHPGIQVVGVFWARAIWNTASTG